MSLSLLIFAVVAAAILLRASREYRRGRVSTILVSAIAGVMYLSALVVPLVLQVDGLLRSKLSMNGLLDRPDGDEAKTLLLRWSIELLVIMLAEMAVTMGRSASAPAPQSRVPWPPSLARRISASLLIIGAVAYVVLPPAALESRAEPGQGLGVLLRGCLVAAIAIAVFYRHFESRIWVVISCLVIVYLIASAVRSPLFLIAFAYVLRQLYLRRVRMRIAVAGVIAVVVTASAMSAYRAGATQGENVTTEQAIAATFDDPLVSVLEAGVDTLDGYRLANLVHGSEPTAWGDLAQAVTTFIPRAVWESKPQALSPYITQKYLGWTASGIFLSPMGYLILVTGDYMLALLFLALFSALLAKLSVRADGTFWGVLVSYCAFRLFLNGSSFDVYYVLVFAVPIALVAALVRRRGDPSCRSSNPLSHSSLEDQSGV